MKRLSDIVQHRGSAALAVGLLLLAAALPVMAGEWKPVRTPKPRATTAIERLPTTNVSEDPAWQPAAATQPTERVVRAVVVQSSDPQIIRTGAVVPVRSEPSRVTHATAPIGPILDRPMQATSHVTPFAEDEIVPTPQGQPHLAPRAQPNPTTSSTMSPTMSMPSDGEIVYENGSFGGNTTYGGDQMMGDMEGFPIDMGNSFGACVDSGVDGGLDPLLYERFPACSLLSFLNEIYVSAGVEGFKGPLDQGRVGNFGFNEAVNVSDSLWHHMGIGYQLGARFVEANFNGDQATGVATSQTRTQTFVTGGFFHRGFYNRGLQYGIVADYLQDDYFDNWNVVQLRYEMSYVLRSGNEFGYWGAGGTQAAPFLFNGVNRTALPIDQNAFFYRRNMNNGGSGRLWGGFTGNNAALFGGDCKIPVNNRFEMSTIFNYLIPTQGVVDGGVAEAWNVGINFTYYPGRPKKACGPHIGPYRSLFGVADNATFMTYQTQP